MSSKSKEPKECFVAEFGLKTEKWQDDLFEKWIFPHNDEFQDAVNSHMLKWFGSLFKDEQFRISWRFPYAVQRRKALEEVKAKLEKIKSENKPLEQRDEDFLKTFETKYNPVCNEITECMKIYGKNLSEQEVNKKCRAYCRAHASSTILNEQYVKMGRKPTQFSKMGLESLSGNIRTYGLDSSGRTFEHGGVTIGMARGCGDRAWAAWNRKINDFKSWGTKIFVKLNTVGDSISFQSAMNCVLYPSERKIKLSFKGLKNDNYEMMLPLLVGSDDVYRQRVLESATEPLAVNVVRRSFGPKWRYFAQITLEGTPPPKNISVGKGKVGIDMGPGGFTMYQVILTGN